ncbi:MAG: molecular chaperone DnaJ [Thermodesulfobacteriota bacterium]
MAKEDYYKILGVNKSANESEIKKAYRKLAHELHPDKNPGNKKAEESFKKINEAYGVLGDAEKRAAYDRFGHVGERAYGGFGGSPGAGFTTDFQDIFGDIFGDFFGAKTKREQGRRGADLQYNLDISFDEAAFGTEKDVEIYRHKKCKKCDGSGAKPGTSPLTCPTCGGSGQASYQQGFFSISRPCTNCRGEGRIIKNPCTECRGSGMARVLHKIKVKVPAGVNTGSRLKLTGEGEDGMRGGPSGDLYVVINVKPHPIFLRENDDIICEIPISFPQAAIGAEIYAPTLEGKLKIKIPPGTQSGRILRLKNKGIASLQGYGRGDEHIIIKVETPTKLTQRQKELLREFEKSSKKSNNPISEGFFNKIKNLF